MKQCCYVGFHGEMPDKNHCVDACEDCNYFLDGSETKNITIILKDVPLDVGAMELIDEIEVAYGAFKVGMVDELDIEFVEERMN